MKCGSCGNEVSGNFCRLCGARLQLDQLEQQEEDQAPLLPSASVLHSYISYILTAAVALTIVVGLAFLLNWLVNRGEFFHDLIYHLMKNVLNIAPEQAAYFSSNLMSNMWTQLMLLHGGAIQGTYIAQYAEEAKQALSFKLHIPVLFSSICGFIVMALTVRLLRPLLKRYTVDQRHRWIGIIGFGMVYAIAATLLLALISPDSTFVFGDMKYTLELGIVFWKQLFLTFIISVAAAVVGVGGWKFLGLPDWNMWVKSIRSFMLICVAFFLFIGGLMTVSWSTANQSQLYSTQITTMGSIWKAYKYDPGVYAIIPNVLLQEFVYSLGGTWHVTGQPAADLLGIKQPIKLQLLSGISLQPAEENLIEDEGQTISVLEKDLRLNWYHLAFILMFLYGLSRIRINRLWIYSVTVAGIIVTIALLSVYSNVKVTMGQSNTTYIGFRLEQSVLAVGVCVTVFLAASYGLQYLLNKRRRTDG